MEIAWLIEREGPLWASVQSAPYVAFKWTADANQAIRFSRKEDGEQVKLLMQDHENLIVTEHQWG